MDELAVNQSIFERAAGSAEDGDLGWGTAAAPERGPSGAKALLAVWGQAARGGGEPVLTSGSLGVKEPAFLGVGKKGQRR